MAGDATPAVLRRELGVGGATLLGLGSIIGTGVFVSIGVAAGVAGPAVIAAVIAAAGVATCNALSSAQLAASHPVSGGTYEYGYRYLNPALGFTAGWMFLLAKSASAATAALGFAGYLLHATGGDPARWQTPLALGTVAVLTLLVLAGVRRSNQVNAVIVSITLAALAWFVVGALPTALANAGESLSPFFRAGGVHDAPWASFFHATALMFVAYTGYGRIATLGEEVHDPRHTIPRAIYVTLIVSLLAYALVAFAGVGAVGADALAAATGQDAAPLALVMDALAVPGGEAVLVVGAMTAMLGVLLNLILGLSRVLLAMGRRGDMPAATARLDAAGTSPWVAVLVMGAVIAALAAVGSVKTTWTFSAFTVLIYYGLTNLAALQLPDDARLHPRWVSWLGLLSCLFLAFWVPAPIWLAGLGLVGVGLVWQRVAGRRFRACDTGGGART